MTTRPSSNPKVVAIILNWNNWAETAECIRSVQASDYESLSILMVDNGSSDGSEKRLRAMFPAIELLQTGSNLGYAGGNNAGIRAALASGAECVLILNNDCRIDRQCISALVEAMLSEADAGMISPKVFAHDDVISHAGSDFNWHNPYVASSRGARFKDTGQFNQQTDLETATGDCLLVARTLLEKIGVLDEGYFLYYEDTDWCWRARQTGFKIVYQPTARAWHPGSLSSGGIQSPMGAYYVLRNKLYFVNTYGPVWARIKNWIHLGLSLVKNSLAWVLNSNRRVARARLMALTDYLCHRRGANPGVAQL